METMTFAQFQATRQWCDDLSEQTTVPEDAGQHGFVYACGAWLKMKNDGTFSTLICTSDYRDRDITVIERKLYDYLIEEESIVAPATDTVRIAYISDEADPYEMTLGELINNFNASDGWQNHMDAQGMREEVVDGRGWIDGLHDNGAYLVLNLDKLGLRLVAPDSSAWAIAKAAEFKEVQP